MALNYRIKNQENHVGIRPGVEGDQILVDIATTANVIVYTVPASKVLLLTDWHLCVLSDSTVNIRMVIRNGAGTIQADICQVTGFLGYPSGPGMSNLFYPIELIATWDIRVVVSAVKTVRGYIHGILIPSGYL